MRPMILIATLMFLAIPAATATGMGGGTPKQIDCPADLQATAQNDGSVRLEWTAAADVDGYSIMRWHGDDPTPPAGTQFTFFSTNQTWFVDADVEAGAVYSYSVWSTLEGETFYHGEDCPRVTITTVPFFTAPLAMLAAVAMGPVAYAMLRRQ